MLILYFISLFLLFSCRGGDLFQQNLGGGFFFACEDLERMFNNSFPACAFSFLFFKVEISLQTLIPFFMPGSVHSGSAG